MAGSTSRCATSRERSGNAAPQRSASRPGTDDPDLWTGRPRARRGARKRDSCIATSSRRTCLLDGAEHVYLADFGLTRRLVDEENPLLDGSSLGTPAYVAPEQLRG